MKKGVLKTEVIAEYGIRVKQDLIDRKFPKKEWCDLATRNRIQSTAAVCICLCTPFRSSLRHLYTFLHPLRLVFVAVSRRITMNAVKGVSNVKVLLSFYYSEPLARQGSSRCICMFLDPHCSIYIPKCVLIPGRTRNPSSHHADMCTAATDLIPLQTKCVYCFPWLSFPWNVQWILPSRQPSRRCCSRQFCSLSRKRMRRRSLSIWQVKRCCVAFKIYI